MENKLWEKTKAIVEGLKEKAKVVKDFPSKSAEYLRRK